jgi:hypothetical protein
LTAKPIWGGVDELSASTESVRTHHEFARLFFRLRILACHRNGGDGLRPGKPG